MGLGAVGTAKLPSASLVERLLNPVSITAVWAQPKDSEKKEQTVKEPIKWTKKDLENPKKYREIVIDALNSTVEFGMDKDAKIYSPNTYEFVSKLDSYGRYTGKPGECAWYPELVIELGVGSIWFQKAKLDPSTMTSREVSTVLNDSNGNPIGGLKLGWTPGKDAKLDIPDWFPIGKKPGFPPAFSLYENRKDGPVATVLFGAGDTYTGGYCSPEELKGVGLTSIRKIGSTESEDGSTLLISFLSNEGKVKSLRVDRKDNPEIANWDQTELELKEGLLIAKK